MLRIVEENLVETQAKRAQLRGSSSSLKKMLRRMSSGRVEKRESAIGNGKGGFLEMEERVKKKKKKNEKGKGSVVVKVEECRRRRRLLQHLHPHILALWFCVHTKENFQLCIIKTPANFPQLFPFPNCHLFFLLLLLYFTCLESKILLYFIDILSK